MLTTVNKEAFPMIRYRTRDITSTLDYSRCECGRTLVRMKKTMGRTDDMLIIRGVNVFLSQIEEVLLAIEGCEPHYELVVERKGALDVLEVRIEVTEHIFFDEMKKCSGPFCKRSNTISSRFWEWVLLLNLSSPIACRDMKEKRYVLSTTERSESPQLNTFLRIKNAPVEAASLPDRRISI